MKKVFIFEIKKLLVPLAIYIGIMAILGCTIMLVSFNLSWESFSTLFGWFMVFLMLGLIFMVFSYNKKRISADMTYSLPVTKRELFIGKYLASLVVLIVMAFLYMVICLIIIGLANMNGLFEYSIKEQDLATQIVNFILGCFIQIAVTIPFFNFILLFYYKANTVLDGIIFIVIGMGLVFLVSQVIIKLSDSNGLAFSLMMYLDGPKYFLKVPYYNNSQSDLSTTLFILHAISGYLISIYLIWYSKKDCSIRTQSICNGIFGYRVFLPLIAGLIPILIVISNGLNSFAPIWYILIAVGLFIGYCFYHRSVKFNKESYIVFASTLGFDFIFLILWMAR